jgi:hypothetical protein
MTDMTSMVNEGEGEDDWFCAHYTRPPTFWESTADVVIRPDSTVSSKPGNRSAALRPDPARWVAAHVYSSTMIEICPELSGSDRILEAIKHAAAQAITGMNGGRQDRRFRNQRVRGSKP